MFYSVFGRYKYSYSSGCWYFVVIQCFMLVFGSVVLSLFYLSFSLVSVGVSPQWRFCVFLLVICWIFSKESPHVLLGLERILTVTCCLSFCCKYFSAYFVASRVLLIWVHSACYLCFLKYCIWITCTRKYKLIQYLFCISLAY